MIFPQTTETLKSVILGAFFTHWSFILTIHLLEFEGLFWASYMAEKCTCIWFPVGGNHLWVCTGASSDHSRSSSWCVGGYLGFKWGNWLFIQLVSACSRGQMQPLGKNELSQSMCSSHWVRSDNGSVSAPSWWICLSVLTWPPLQRLLLCLHLQTYWKLDGSSGLEGRGHRALHRLREAVSIISCFTLTST